MNEMTILPLFSKHVAISGDTYNMSEEELDFIKNLKRIENIDYNSVTENQYILELPELKNLKKWIQENVEAYFYKFLKVDDIEKIYITQSWSNLSKKGQKHHTHNHPNSVISGVMHFDDNDSNLNFYSDDLPYFFSFNHKEYDIYNSQKWSWPTKKYNLFLFPSKLKHDVDIQRKETDRISLSFNTWVSGIVGIKNESTLLELK
tara:strand:- start:105 stop:716 length:612 start_codon:yes stop_codon:yes gene_type:complete